MFHVNEHKCTYSLKTKRKEKRLVTYLVSALSPIFPLATVPSLGSNSLHRSDLVANKSLLLGHTILVSVPKDSPTKSAKFSYASLPHSLVTIFFVHESQRLKPQQIVACVLSPSTFDWSTWSTVARKLLLQVVLYS